MGRKGKKKTLRPKARLSNPFKHFNRCGRQYIDAIIQIWREDPMYRNIPFQKAIKLIEKIKAEEIKIHEKVFRTLWDQFKGTDEAMDLFSGSGLATVPLVKGGRISRLSLIDDMATSSKESRAGLALIEGDDRFDMRKLHIDSETETGALPAIQQVILSETGIVLAPEHKKPSHLERMPIPDPNMYRSGHIINPEFTLSDILRILSDVEGRIIHVLDTPFFQSTAPIENTRDFIGEKADEAGWQMTSFSQIQRADTFHAIIENK